MNFFKEANAHETGKDAYGLPIAKFVIGVVIQNPYFDYFSQDLSLLNVPSESLVKHLVSV